MKRCITVDNFDDYTEKGIKSNNNIFVSKAIWLLKRIICAVGIFPSKDQNPIQLVVDGKLILYGNC